MKDKGITMAQWVNRLRNNIFVNLPPLPLLCENFWSPTPSATGSYGRQAGWPSVRPSGRRNTGEFRNFQSWLYCRFVNQGTASLQPYQCIPASFFG